MSGRRQTTPTCADNPVDRALIGLRDFDRHAEKLATQSAALFVSDEACEGMLAFLQKRPPSSSAQASTPLPLLLLPTAWLLWTIPDGVTAGTTAPE